MNSSIPESEIQRAARVISSIKKALSKRSQHQHSDESYEQNLISNIQIHETRQLETLIANPYFGAVEYSEQGTPHFYLVGKIQFDSSVEQIVSPWSPIGELYYQNCGTTEIAKPGELKGDPPIIEPIDLYRKRQYTFYHGDLVSFSFEGNSIDEQGALNLSWNDQLLKTLSQNASKTMHDIVATIQEEQNRAIRDNRHKILVVKGVAGSGKTAVALHRVSYLLYTHKNEFKTEDFLVVSSNRSLSEYVEDVLPSLGNEGVPLYTMDEIALGRLKALGLQQISFETSEMFYNEISGQLEQWQKEDIMWKLSIEFAKELLLWEQFELNGRQFTTPRQLLAAYREFLTKYYHRDQLTVPKSWENLRQIDLWPILYLSRHFIGEHRKDKETLFFGSIRHLMLDEMQDYSPVQYLFLRAVVTAHDCNWTLLGDPEQKVQEWLPESDETQDYVLPERYVFCLDTCYRSTKEIMEFAYRLCPCVEIKLADRHGPPPQELEFQSEQDMTIAIAKRCRKHKNRKGYLAIVCKTDNEVDDLAKNVRKLGISLCIIGKDSLPESGVLIGSSRTTKGWEFDEVLIPRAKNLLKSTSLDKRLLYVACTRAMHRLSLFSVRGDESNRIPDNLFSNSSIFQLCEHCHRWVLKPHFNQHIAGHRPCSRTEPINNMNNQDLKTIKEQAPQLSNTNASREDTIAQSLDGSAGWHVRRDNGQFGSHPMHDAFDDESRP